MSSKMVTSCISVLTLNDKPKLSYSRILLKLEFRQLSNTDREVMTNE